MQWQIEQHFLEFPQKRKTPQGIPKCLKISYRSSFAAGKSCIVRLNGSLFRNSTTFVFCGCFERSFISKVAEFWVQYKWKAPHDDCDVNKGNVYM